MTITTDARNRAFPGAEIEAALRGELGAATRDEAEFRGTSGKGSPFGGYVEPVIDSLVAVSVLVRIEPLMAPMTVDESLIRPGGYASVDDCVRDIAAKLERRWRKWQQEKA